MSTHKSSDYKLTAVKYFLDNNVSQLDTCKIFKLLLKMENSRYKEIYRKIINLKE